MSAGAARWRGRHPPGGMEFKTQTKQNRNCTAQGERGWGGGRGKNDELATTQITLNPFQKIFPIRKILININICFLLARVIRNLMEKSIPPPGGNEAGGGREGEGGGNSSNSGRNESSIQIC